MLLLKNLARILISGLKS